MLKDMASIFDLFEISVTVMTLCSFAIPSLMLTLLVTILICVTHFRTVHFIIFYNKRKVSLHHVE